MTSDGIPVNFRLSGQITGLWKTKLMVVDPAELKLD